MTRYNVHISREIRLTFHRIEADTPEAAAAIARDRLISDADDVDDCDGENFAALVDVAGDDGFTRSKIIDFEAERLRKAAPVLYEALIRLTDAAADLCAAINGVTDQFDSEAEELQSACRNADDAIAMAKSVDASQGGRP